tara:strand:+ start:828 stop:1163 length:336 start_codon:yes stop_codon:yes gene_type:complete
MLIIEYKLHPMPSGGRPNKLMKIPDFVTDGGYWINPDDHTLIGTVPDDIEYYVPDTVVILTPSELEARQLAIHAKHPMKKGSPTPDGELEEMTEAEIKAEIQSWVAERNKK